MDDGIIVHRKRRFNDRLRQRHLRTVFDSLPVEKITCLTMQWFDTYAKTYDRTLNVTSP